VDFDAMLAACMAPFGESVTLGGVTATGVVDLGGTIINQDTGEVRVGESSVLVRTVDFPALTSGAACIVRSVSYKVRDLTKEGLDGRELRVWLKRAG
jgi:hypothetical protein